MIRKLLTLTVVSVLVLTASLPALASDKIAVVSLQRALNEVNEGKKAKLTLKKDFDDKKKQLEVMKTDLETMRADLEKQKSVLSKDALQTKAQALQTKFMEMQNKEMTYINELKTKEGESAKKILLGLRDIVLKMAKDDGYTLVLENSADVVLYAQTAEDITDKVISAYNSGSK